MRGGAECKHCQGRQQLAASVSEQELQAMPPSPTLLPPSSSHLQHRQWRQSEGHATLPLTMPPIQP